MKNILAELSNYIIGGVIGSVIGLIVTILYTKKFEILLSNIFKNRIGNKSSRDITGVWVTQYKYPSIDSTGSYFEKIETQIVIFKQTGNYVIGNTIEADAHPQAFEGRITLDRYFTGIYVNSINHQNYHGAFQLILSNGKGRMKGKWIGFDNKGTEINEGNWRWQQINTNNEISFEDTRSNKEKYKSHSLFDDAEFIM